MVYLITGKAGAGKSTYAKKLEQELIENGQKVFVLDADTVRMVYENQDYTDAGREAHLLNIAKIAQLAETMGFVAIVAAISPKAEWRDKMRDHWYESRLVYIPGGTLWAGTTYETPTDEEW